MVKPRTPAGQHGLIHYRKTTSGKIEARTRYRHDNGRLALIQATGKSKTAARLALEEKLAGLTIDTSGELTADSTIKALAAVWAEANQEKKLSHNTTRQRQYILTRFILPALGDLTLREITSGRLVRFIKSVQTDSAPYANMSRTVLSQMFKLALSHDALTRKKGAREHKAPHPSHWSQMTLGHAVHGLLTLQPAKHSLTLLSRQMVHARERFQP